MTRLLLLLISCATLFAQRTPFKVNGTVVNNPDLTNSATITWTNVGAKISGAAAGGGGDTIWTNDNGTITGDSTNGLALLNITTNIITVSQFGGINSGVNSATFSTSTAEDPGLRANSVYALDGIGLAQIVTKAAETSADMLGHTNETFTELVSEGDPGFKFSEVSAGRYDSTGTLWIINLYTDESDSLQLQMQHGNHDLMNLQPTLGQTETTYYYDTLTNHTSGYIFEYDNQTTNKISGTWDGVVNAVGGFGSTATDTAVTIAATGWTNTFGKSAQVMMSGVALVYKVADAAGTFWYTNGTALPGAEFTLQTGGKLIITSGTLTVGRAKAW